MAVALWHAAVVCLAAAANPSHAVSLVAAAAAAAAANPAAAEYLVLGCKLFHSCV